MDPDAGASVSVAAGVGGARHLLAILPTRGAVELQPSLTTRGVRGRASARRRRSDEIIAFVDAGGVVHSFYGGSDAVRHAWRAADGTAWNGPDLFAGGAGLAASKVPISGEWVESRSFVRQSFCVSFVVPSGGALARTPRRKRGS